MFSFKYNFNSFSIVFLIANQGEQHIFLSNHKISAFFKKNWNCGIIRYSDSWNFMFIQLFVQKLFHFSKKTLKMLTVLKCHTVFDYVQIKCFLSKFYLEIFIMEFCLNRGLVWKFLSWKLIIVIACFCKTIICWIVLRFWAQTRQQ